MAGTAASKLRGLHTDVVRFSKTVAQQLFQEVAENRQELYPISPRSPQGKFPRTHPGLHKFPGKPPGNPAAGVPGCREQKLAQFHQGLPSTRQRLFPAIPETIRRLFTTSRGYRLIMIPQSDQDHPSISQDSPMQSLNMPPRLGQYSQELCTTSRTIPQGNFPRTLQEIINIQETPPTNPLPPSPQANA